jgi:flagellum-specific ATP synthase
MCMMDSVTRFAMAQREIGLSAGEPPTTKGYPPTTFAELPRLLERAGPGIGDGNITGLFTVLVDGDDHNEPIADAVRGLLDGHVWLARRLAERGHYPAIDVLRSISRLANDLSTAEERQARQVIRELLATYAENEDLITIGAYRRGANRTLDAAVEMRDEINRLLRQAVDERVELDEVRREMIGLAAKCTARLTLATPPASTAPPSAVAAPAKRSNVIKHA